MSIESRLRRMEQHLPPSEDHCDDCGCPARLTRSLVHEAGTGEVPACPVCGRKLDLAGWPLADNGKVIVIEASEGQERSPG